MFDLESQIRKWKTHLYSAGSISCSDMEELESHLRNSIDELNKNHIDGEEAFLLAVRRLGDVEGISEEFAKISTEDMWRQLLVPADNIITARRKRKELAIVVGLVFFAGFLSKIPVFFGYGDIEANSLIYLKNGVIFAFTPVAIYFIWKRSLPVMRSMLVMGVFLVSAMIVNLYPSYEPYHTALLSAMHLPIVLLYLLIYFYGGPSLPKVETAFRSPENGFRGKASGWRSANSKLNFVRFAGEAFIYAVLIGLGGLVLLLLTGGTFELIDIDASPFIQSWMAPFGFFGLFTVAAYLVGQKKNLLESIAPVLARIFTPLFLLVVLSLITAFLLTPNIAYENRAVLIWFDIILALIVALTLYSMSAKDFSGSSASGRSSAGGQKIWDILTLTLAASAVLIDVIALSGIVIRLSDYGFTPNKTAALGENIILLINLVLLTVGYFRYITGRQVFQSIVAMQMRFLKVYAIWAAFVVVVFPLIFGFK